MRAIQFGLVVCLVLTLGACSGGSKKDSEQDGDKKDGDKKTTTEEDGKTKVLTPAEAARKDGEVCIVEFKVEAVKIPRRGPALLLQSSDDSRAKDLFTAALTKKVVDELKSQGKESLEALEFLEALTKMFRGKTVRVTGKVTRRADRPEIEVAELKDLNIVEKK
jgi:hypothetical protein